MKTLASIAIAAVTLSLNILSGCNNPEIKQAENSVPGKEQTTTIIKTPVVNFKAAVYIDSTDFVMYPLSNKKKDTDDSYLKIGSRGDMETYWNIAFYNIASKTCHLLDDKRKMIITSYTAQDGGSQYSVEDAITTDRTSDIIFYSVIVTDYNKDGKLNLDDPSYLFISDKKGNNFKQISPDGLRVTGWKIIKQAGKILIQAAADSNNDKKFDSDDDALPYIYDIKTGGIAQLVFGKDFTDATGKLLEKQWNK